MSCWVRSSQIVRYRSAHALPVVVSIWQAATLAVVSEGRIRTLDVVPREARQRRLVAGVRAAGGLIVLYPFRVDELRDAADGLLRLVGGDTGQVDGDAVVA